MPLIKFQVFLLLKFCFSSNSAETHMWCYAWAVICLAMIWVLEAWGPLLTGIGDEWDWLGP